MKISIILMPILILSIFSISQVYAQNSSNNTLRTCVDVYMEKFDEAVAKLDQKFQKDKDKLNESLNNSSFLKRISTDACVTSYTQTGMFGHLLSSEEQEKFVTASFVKLMMEEKNKMTK
ncbi:MAG: hypothetical protein ACR2F1_06695 [Nitrososphaeraceae archaeon]